MSDIDRLKCLILKNEIDQIRIGVIFFLAFTSIGAILSLIILRVIGYL